MWISLHHIVHSISPVATITFGKTKKIFEGCKELVCPNMVTFAGKCACGLKIMFSPAILHLAINYCKAGQVDTLNLSTEQYNNIIILIIQFTRLYYSIVR